VYDRLAAQKLDGESFTMTVERLLKGHVASEGTCGAAVEQAGRIWGIRGSAEEAELMGRVIQQGREATRWDVEPLP